MDRRNFISACTLGTLGMPLCGCLLQVMPAFADETGTAPHWGYAGANGPERWGSLSTDYGVCGSGSQQSPINLVTADAIHATIGHIRMAYRPVPLRIVNNGHTIQVNYPPGSTLTLRGPTFNLVQFHFHAPSEHTRDGVHYDMELHLVHTDAARNIAVLGVLLTQGAANPALDPIWSNMPAQAGSEKTVAGSMVDASRLVPASDAYFAYVGSLTTPPCTEGVKWVVLTQTASVSREQVQKFKSIIGMNARPVQPLDQRFLLEQL